MLYVFHGTNIAEASDKARHLVDSLRTKRPDASFVRLEGDSWDVSVIEGHLGGQGLFSSKYIIYLDRVTENVEAKDELPKLASALQESPNIFIVLEGKLNADLKKAFEKSAEKIVTCDIKKEAEGDAKNGFNSFALAGAVGNRDVLRAWKLYREEVDRGDAMEKILGGLFWKAKSMGSKELARELITLYHDGHRGLCDMELATERLILSMRP